MAVLFLANIGLQLTIPQILKFFIDSVTDNQPLSVLMNTAGFFIGIAILRQVVAVGVTYTSQNIGWRATNNLRIDLASHCLKLDMGFHKRHRPGELIEKIDGDVSDMFEFFSNLLVELLSHMGLMIGVLVLLFMKSWYIGLAMTFFVAFAAWVMGRIQAFAVPRHTALREKVTDFYGYLGEILNSTEDIRSNGAVSKVIRQLHKKMREWLPVRRWAAFANISTFTSSLFIFALGNAIAFGIGGLLWSKGLITVGTVYLIFHYTEMLSMPLRQIQRQMANLQKAGASATRIEALLQTTSNVSDGTGAPLPSGPLSLDIKDLAFAYEHDSPVLSDLSLKLEPGKVLGVLGRTGSGKTTLARLINRFYDSSQGDIWLNGQPINTIPLESLRSQVAFVTQDVQLFNATVRDNLTFFNEEISDQQIWTALRNMGLEEWVKGLPLVLDTVLATDGGGLSAGQAQLLAFVRVFLKDPGLVILDEASSKLDPITEQLMEGAIDKLFQGRTGIIIAHRLKTIERADEILILHEGRIREHGSRMGLLTHNDSYFNTLLRQGLQEVLA